MRPKHSRTNTVATKKQPATGAEIFVAIAAVPEIQKQLKQAQSARLGMLTSFRATVRRELKKSFKIVPRFTTELRPYAWETDNTQLRIRFWFSTYVPSSDDEMSSDDLAVCRQRLFEACMQLGLVAISIGQHSDSTFDITPIPT